MPAPVSVLFSRDRKVSGVQPVLKELIGSLCNGRGSYVFLLAQDEQRIRVFQVVFLVVYSLVNPAKKISF